jgi:hypothetical protein
VRPRLVGTVVRARGGEKAADTYRGVLDGDRRTDRYVGPLLLSPSQWSIVGVDADDDGNRDPHDLDDAALATSVLLCAEGSLRTRAGATAALRALDTSRSFAREVLAVEAHYSDQLAADPRSVPLAAPPSDAPELPVVAPAPPGSAPDGSSNARGGGTPDTDQDPGAGLAPEPGVEGDGAGGDKGFQEPEQPTDPPEEEPQPSVTTLQAAYDPATGSVTVTVTVALESGDPAEGTVDLELRRDDEVVATVTAELADGTATHVFTDVTAPASYLVLATYAGSEDAEASAAEVAVAAD